ncbi:MAG: metal ABC transporter permease [Betaproteobacteria bacterium]|nr:metal ABC transporter permease [Betaproteobacteria bacterium]
MALLCTILVGALCGLLSPTIVLKQRAYIGDTLAHLVFPGLVAGYFAAAAFGLPLWGAMMLGAVVTGLVGSFAVERLERLLNLPPDSAAVLTLTGFFAAGVVAVSRLRGTRLDLERFLFGDVLNLTDLDALLLFIVLFLVAALIFVLRKDWDAWLSDSEFARLMGFRVAFIERLFPVVVTAAVLTGLVAVGGLMISALLTVPAALLPPKSAFSPRTVVFSTVLALIGLLAVFALDWPVGSTIVLVGFVLVLAKAIVVSLA